MTNGNVRKLAAIDRLFLGLESKGNPMHMASVSVFKPPSESTESYGKLLYSRLLREGVEPPFNQRLTKSRFTKINRWETDVQFRADDHLSYRRLPEPGRKEQLQELLDTLHSKALDRSRALWEMHIIDGLKDGSFVVYLKVHHALCDGMRMVDLTAWWLDHERGLEPRSPWRGFQHITSRPNKKAKARRSPLQRIRKLATTARDLRRLASKLNTVGSPDGAARTPFRAPASVLNAPVTSARKMSLLDFSISEMKSIGARHNATVNDVLLAVCGGAFRRYLRHRRSLPEESLIASVPVLISHKNRANNSFSYLSIELGTSIEDPHERLCSISSFTRRSKDILASHSSSVAIAFAVMGLGASLAVGALGALGIRPPVNLAISNMAASKKTWYWGDAELISVHPVFNLVGDQALNITVVQYQGNLHVGLVCCGDVVPDLPVLSHCFMESFDDLRKQRRAAA